MKDYLRISGMLFNQPLMVHEFTLDSAVHWANQAMSLNIVNLNVTNPAMMEGGEIVAARGDSTQQSGVVDSGVALVRVFGPLVSRGSQLAMCETMTDYETMRRQLDAALADPAVEHIVLDLDSPGGSVAGAFELADKIYQARTIKPITALVNFKAFSAGYLLASACSDVVMSKTSGVGSVGVIAKHADLSKRYEQQGVKVTTVYAGARKNDLNSEEPISDAALKFLDGMVQSNYEMFTSAVAQYRGLTVDAVKATEAGVYFGQQAIDIGFADQIADQQDAINQIAANVAANRQAKSPKRSVSARAAAMNNQNRM